jgi:hypothetical protein
MLPIASLSSPFAKLASAMRAALQRFVAPRSCAADRLLAACASHVPGVAVPWNLYGLKITETQSAFQTIAFFTHLLTLFAPFLPQEKGVWLVAD